MTITSPKPLATWRRGLLEAMQRHDDAWANIEATTLSENDLDREFYDGYGLHEGVPFTVWTAKRVYFPAVYDGSEWVSSVSRHPDGKPTEHIGGE